MEQLGLLGYPLLICSCLIMAIVIERVVYFFSTFPISKQLVDGIVKDKEIAVSAELEKRLQKNMFGSLILELIDNKSLSLIERENYANIRLGDIHGRLNRFLPILKILATISPLLGLLGTVLGMIDSFQMISSADKPITPSLVSGGISQALLTTAVGLLLAILALVTHALFQLRVSKIMMATTRQLNLVNLSLEKTNKNRNLSL